MSYLYSMWHNAYEEKRGICGPQKTQLQSAELSPIQLHPV